MLFYNVFIDFYVPQILLIIKNCSSFLKSNIQVNKKLEFFIDLLLLIFFILFFLSYSQGWKLLTEKFANFK